MANFSLKNPFFLKRGMPVSELGELSRESISENFIVFGRNSTFT